jgi:predicted nucleic acid-binding protein
MISKTFVDTNILIYCLDQADPVKRSQARVLLKSSQDGHSGVVSTQVFQELYLVATSRLGVKPLLAKKIISAYSGRIRPPVPATSGHLIR